MAESAGDSSGAVLPLPKLHKSQQGVSTASASHYKAEVSNANGYMCHIHVDVHFDVPPQLLFEMMTHPDNSCAFRDIKQVGYRKVLHDVPGHKIVEVEQVGAMKIILGLERSFTTLLRVVEDSRDPACLITSFELVKSDILSKFHGQWHLTPVTDASGAITGCHGVLEQDVLPRGCPPFLAHLPVLGGILRGASLNTIRRLVEDMTVLVERVRKSGKSVGEVIDAVAAERGHVHSHKGQEWSHNGADVASFRISDGHLSSEEEEEVAVAAVAAGEQLTAAAAAKPCCCAAGGGDGGSSAAACAQQGSG